MNFNNNIDLNAILAGCTNNNRVSQNELYNIYCKKMLAVCLRYCSNKQTAEDCLQEGFISAFKNIKQFNAIGPFEAWLRKIMVNCCLQKLRSKTLLYANSYKEIENIEISVNETITNQLQTADLLAMVQKLPPTYKIIFNLYAIDGLKHKEIAELLKISEGTSKSNLFDARRILQKMIQQENLKYIAIKL